jgi:hypothetical protein
METANLRIPWNKGKLIGQKTPLKLQEIYAIRTRLQLSKQVRELAMFDLAIDSKLRACNLVNLRVRDLSHGSLIASRAMVMQQKTKRPVQLLLGHSKLESTVRYLGIEVDDALEIAEQTDI